VVERVLLLSIVVGFVVVLVGAAYLFWLGSRGAVSVRQLADGANTREFNRAVSIVAGALILLLGSLIVRPLVGPVHEDELSGECLHRGVRDEAAK
jgi:hypothetical protein